MGEWMGNGGWGWEREAGVFKAIGCIHASMCILDRDSCAGSGSTHWRAVNWQHDFEKEEDED